MLPRGGKPADLALARCVDLLIAILALVFLAPLLVVLAMLVMAQDGGPAVFGHRRVGRHGKTFRCLKFRSMVTDADTRLTRHLEINPAARAEWAVDHKLRNDPRVTPLGRFLRQSSLDELPQLLNVLRGEMSLVGPRPIVEGEIHRYGRYFAHYCRVRPGITGLWQVMGRNDVSYRRRVALDVTYVRRSSAYTYFAVLARTVPAVLNRQGVY